MSTQQMSRPTLRQGSTGPMVVDLQNRLNQLGAANPPLKADGAFGSMTLRAVKAFQSARKLVADGVVGPKTWAELDAAQPAARPPQSTGPGPTAQAPEDWTQRTLDDRMLAVMEILVDRYQYPVNGAAGIVGNLAAESEVIPNRLEGSVAASPMQTRDFSDRLVEFTADQVRDRNTRSRVGPRLAGAGLAQWTSANRRRGLFQHVFEGRTLGAAILHEMTAQVDYLVTELREDYPAVERVLTQRAVTVDQASDEVVYNFEIPGSILADGVKLRRSDQRVQTVFQERRRRSQRALRAFQAARPG